MSAEEPPPGVIAGEERGNGIGTAGFVCGLTAFVLSLVPVLFFAAWSLGPFAVILGSVGLGRARQQRGGRRRSLWGVILGSVAMVLPALWFVALG